MRMKRERAAYRTSRKMVKRRFSIGEGCTGRTSGEEISDCTSEGDRTGPRVSSLMLRARVKLGQVRASSKSLSYVGERGPCGSINKSR